MKSSTIASASGSRERCRRVGGRAYGSGETLLAGKVAHVGLVEAREVDEREARERERKVEGSKGTEGEGELKWTGSSSALALNFVGQYSEYALEIGRLEQGKHRMRDSAMLDLRSLPAQGELFPLELHPFDFDLKFTDSSSELESWNNHAS